MRSGFRVVAVSAIVAAAALVGRADVRPTVEAAHVQLQLGNLLFEEGRFNEALEAYLKAVRADDHALVREARAGVIQSALRVAEFVTARTEAELLFQDDPRSASAISLYADALWACGLFDQAE